MSVFNYQEVKCKGIKALTSSGQGRSWLPNPYPLSVKSILTPHVSTQGHAGSW